MPMPPALIVPKFIRLLRKLGSTEESIRHLLSTSVVTTFTTIASTITVKTLMPLTAELLEELRIIEQITNNFDDCDNNDKNCDFWRSQTIQLWENFNQQAKCELKKDKAMENQESPMNRSFNKQMAALFEPLDRPSSMDTISQRYFYGLHNKLQDAVKMTDRWCLESKFEAELVSKHILPKLPIAIVQKFGGLCLLRMYDLTVRDLKTYLHKENFYYKSECDKPPKSVFSTASSPGSPDSAKSLSPPLAIEDDPLALPIDMVPWTLKKEAEVSTEYELNYEDDELSIKDAENEARCAEIEVEFICFNPVRTPNDLERLNLLIQLLTRAIKEVPRRCKHSMIREMMLFNFCYQWTKRALPSSLTLQFLEQYKANASFYTLKTFVEDHVSAYITELNILVSLAQEGTVPKCRFCRKLGHYLSLCPCRNAQVCDRCHNQGHQGRHCSEYQLRAEFREKFAELGAVVTEEDLRGLNRMKHCIVQCETDIAPFRSCHELQLEALSTLLSKLPTNTRQVYLNRPGRKSLASLRLFINQIIQGLRGFDMMKNLMEGTPQNEEWHFKVEEIEAH